MKQTQRISLFRAKRRAQSRQVLRGTCWTVLLGLVSAACAFSQDPASESAAKRYALAISRAQADLDAGRVSEAVQKLDATEKSLRSFEFDYLRTRAKLATANGGAPDLVRTVAVPDVETRYGLLNEVDLRLAFLCRDGALRIYDLTAPDAKPRTASRSDGSPIWTGAFSRDGKTCVTGHENGEVVVWDSKIWEVRHATSLGEKRPVRELAVAPDGSAFVAESQAALELWSLAGGKPTKVAALGERYNFGEGLAFSPQGNLIATGGMFDIILHDAKTGEKTKSMRHASYTMGLEFSPDGTRIASAPRGNVNKFLSVFDVAEGKSLFTAGPFPNYIAGLAFTPDGKRVAATGPQKDVRLFDAATGVVMLTLPRRDHTAKPAVSRDGRLLGWSEPSGYMYINLDERPDAK
jgi:WD40 repeat protein